MNSKPDEIQLDYDLANNMSLETVEIESPTTPSELITKKVKTDDFVTYTESELKYYIRLITFSYFCCYFGLGAFIGSMGPVMLQLSLQTNCEI